MYNSMKIPNKKTFSVPAVKELAAKDPNLLPQRYIRSQEERSSSLIANNNYNATSSIPIIDMASLVAQHDDHHSRKSEMDNLALACQEWGFFQVVNHGIPESLLEGMKGIVRRFFQLPLEEKLKYGIQEREGYGQAFVVSDEQKLDWCDMFYLFTLPKNVRQMDFWPTCPVDFRKTLDEYSTELEKLYESLMRLIAETLGIKGGFLIKAGEWTESQRMNFYPPCPRPDLVMGLGPHSDSASLTILLQDDEVPGLYISKDGQWVPVPPVPGALVINFGDMLEVMSNGKYKSIEHMALPNKEKERISVATFWLPTPEAQIGPHADLVDDEHPAMFNSFRSDDFFKIFFKNKLQRKSTLDCFRVESSHPS